MSSRCTLHKNSWFIWSIFGKMRLNIYFNFKARREGQADLINGTVFSFKFYQYVFLFISIFTEPYRPNTSDIILIIIIYKNIFLLIILVLFHVAIYIWFCLSNAVSHWAKHCHRCDKTKLIIFICVYTNIYITHTYVMVFKPCHLK